MIANSLAARSKELSEPRPRSSSRWKMGAASAWNRVPTRVARFRWVRLCAPPNRPLRRLQPARVGQREPGGQQVRSDVGIGFQLGQATVPEHLRLGEVLGPGDRSVVQPGVARQGVEELIVDGRDQDCAHLVPQPRQFSLLSGPLVDQLEPRLDLAPNLLDVGDEHVGALADLRNAGGAAVALLQLGHLLLEGQHGPVDSLPFLEEFQRGLGRGQAGGRVGQDPAVLGDTEGGGQLGHAALVDPGLRVSHPVEREPADEAGGQSHGDRCTDAHVELGGYAGPDPQM